MKALSDISNGPISLRKTTEQSRITGHENLRRPLSVAVDEGIDIAVKQQSLDLVFESLFISKPVDSSLIDDADHPREDLAKTDVSVLAAVQHEQKISPNGDDVDIKPQRIMKKKKKLVKRKKRVSVLNFKLLEEYPGSFFMAVRCKGCFFVTTFHSHPQEYVSCPRCLMCLCLPGERAGDRGKLTENCSFWTKTDKIFSNFLYDDDLPPNFFG